MKTKRPPFKIRVRERISKELITLLEAESFRMYLGRVTRLGLNRSIAGYKFQYDPINQLILWMASYKRNFEYPIFGTYSQYREANAHILKGSKSIWIIKKEMYESKNPTNEVFVLHNTGAYDQLKIINSVECYRGYDFIFNIKESSFATMKFPLPQKVCNREELNSTLNILADLLGMGNFKIETDDPRIHLKDNNKMTGKGYGILSYKLYAILNHLIQQKKLNKLYGFPARENEKEFAELIIYFASLLLSAEFKIPFFTYNMLDEKTLRTLFDLDNSAIFRAIELAEKSIKILKATLTVNKPSFQLS